VVTDSQTTVEFTLTPKSQKTYKALIQPLPFITPAEDISERLMELGFDVITVKQLSAIRQSSTVIFSSTS
jgi:hypothetical protein